MIWELKAWLTYLAQSEISYKKFYMSGTTGDLNTRRITRQI